jgi:hypothetical protein
LLPLQQFLLLRGIQEKFARFRVQEVDRAMNSFGAKQVKS